MKTFLKNTWIFALLLLFSTGLKAQFQYLDIYVDSSGVPVPNQPVWIVIQSNPVIYISGISNASGIFRDSIPSLSASVQLYAYSLDCNRNYIGKSGMLDTANTLYSDTITMSCIGSPLICTADFSSSPGGGNAVNFSNNSTQTFGAPASRISYTWNFGDGLSSSQENPSHTYGNAGFYNVSLTISIKDSLDTSFVLKSDVRQKTVQAGTPACNAAFQFTVNDSTVNFNNVSTFSGVPPSSIALYQWNFGDGAFSGQRDPTHNYAINGDYEVCLSQFVVDTSGVSADTLCTNTFCDSLTIFVEPLVCAADFNVQNIDSTTRSITLSDNSTISKPGYNRFLRWDFGDGSSDTLSTVTHAYAPDTTNTFQVCLSLVVADSASGDTVCTNLYCENITIANSSPNFCVAGFIVDTINSYNGKVYVWNTSWPYNGNSDYQNSYTWSFGDQSFSNQAFPTHIYNGAGTYVLQLELNSLELATGKTCRSLYGDTLTVDSLGGIVNKNGTAFKLIVLNPENIGVDEETKFTASVYPNPANDRLVVEVTAHDKSKWSFRMTDLKGSLIWQEERSMKDTDHMDLDVSKMREGLYIFSIQSEEGISHHKIKIDR
ncbi:MAG: PKD domain-containing protein [Owenweeksia sp.]